jgi:Ca-activated chloride channel family protein
MLNTMTSKGALTTTTALVACGFLFLTPQGQDILRPPSAPQITMTEFDGTARAPQAETTPEMVEELRGDMTALDASTGAGAEIAQAPLVAPTSDDQFADRSVPAVRERTATLPSIQPLEMESDAIAQVAPQADRMEESELTMLAPSAPKTIEGVSNLTAERRIVVAPAPTPADDVDLAPIGNTESFANEAANPLKITAEEPVSTFSIDVDTAAYAVVRSSLARGQLPPAQAVRIEELINYFPYDYAAPDAGEAPFRPTVTTFQTPWNADTQLVHIALQGQMPEIAARPPLNLVFLIDTSGSMDDPTKLPLLKQSFRLMLDQLRPQDQVAIVEYAGSAGQVLAPTSASERTTILQAIGSLGAGGSTNGQGGLEQAYSVAETMRESGEVNRVILATDGDFNVGLSDPDALKDFIADKRETGTYLSVLGFGRGNLDDATMQALAQNGNGTAAYIDTLSEAQKVLVDQLSGALFPIAGDVKVQVEFNPAQVAEYRLIGYETRALNREDFNNDAVDAGELGAGHAVTAIYEVTPVGSPAQLSDPLRYAPNTVAETSNELGFLKLRYKEPGEDVSQLIETPIIGDSIPGTETNFAAAIAGFGQLLRNPQYLGDWGYDDAIALANANRGEDSFGYRTEAVQLMRLAQSLSR